MNSIKIFIRNVYGKQTIYPDPECPAACAFAMLVSKRTFNCTDLAYINLLGFEVITVKDPAAPEVTATCAAELVDFLDPTGELRKAGLLEIQP
jgi:hypothetical protein